ncbi:Gamma-DL-glutamyl hydrolase precursor [compost metagenome]
MFERFIRTKTGVNFRKGPGTQYASMGLLTKGTELQVLADAEGTWYKARLSNGTEGYISSKPEYVESFTPVWLAKAVALIEYANKYVGTPYVFGSDRRKDDSFDCSDFTQWCYLMTLGIDIPNDSRSQSVSGQAVPADLNTLRTGDLLFFDTNGDGIVNHVGFYVYPGLLLHTASTSGKSLNSDLSVHKATGGGVTWAKFDANNWHYKRMTGARRIL